MQYRDDIYNGETLSALGFGGLRFPLKDGKVDEEKAINLIHIAIDNGINYIDTAYPYHKGQSEVIIGKALKDGYREKVKLATKLPHWILHNEEAFYDMLDIQLSKLQTNYIDYYLIHMISSFESWQRLKHLEIDKFIENSKKDGKIKYIGFSSHMDLEAFKKVIDDYPWDFCQIQYNFLDEYNQAGVEGLRYASNKGISVIVMEPLRGGMLVKDVPSEVNLIFKESNRSYTPVEWALRWIWNHPEVTCVLSGMNEEKQILENIKISENALPNHLDYEELAIIEKVKQVYQSKLKVPCTGCRYCMPCPFGVNIPGCFELYNAYHLFHKKSSKNHYIFRNGGLMGQKSLASLCKACGKCEKVCPQKIEIRNELYHVKKTFEGPLVHSLIWFAKPIIKITRIITKIYVRKSKKKYKS